MRDEAGDRRSAGGGSGSGRGEPRPAVLVRSTLVVAATVGLALLAWMLSHVLLLGFAAVVVAVVFLSLSGLLEDWLKLPPRLALLASILLIAAFFGGFAWVLGSRLASEFSTLVDRLPDAAERLGDRLGIEDFGSRVVGGLREIFTGSGIVQDVASFSTQLVGAGAGVLLVVAAAIYLAAHPDRYRAGILLLFPRRNRERAGRATAKAGRALRLWLVGQIASMATVGVLTTVGLYLIGMPSALALGFIAGVSEFIPYVGPLLSAVPALALALSEGGTTVIWVLALYVAVQQLEGYVIVPLVQRKAVDVPPLVTLFGIVALGTIFGPLGVVVAGPLTVVLYVLVTDLYIREELHEPVKSPGER